MSRGVPFLCPLTSLLLNVAGQKTSLLHEGGKPPVVTMPPPYSGMPPTEVCALHVAQSSHFLIHAGHILIPDLSTSGARLAEMVR